MPDSPPVTSAVLFSSIMVWFLSQNEGLPRLLVPKFPLIRNFNPDDHVLDGEASEPMADPNRHTSIAQLDGTPRRHLYSGPNLGRAHTIADLRARHHKLMPRFVREYLEAGAEDEATLTRERAAFAEWRTMVHTVVAESQRSRNRTSS